MHMNLKRSSAGVWSICARLAEMLPCSHLHFFWYLSRFPRASWPLPPGIHNIFAQCHTCAHTQHRHAGVQIVECTTDPQHARLEWIWYAQAQSCWNSQQSLVHNWSYAQTFDHNFQEHYECPPLAIAILTNSKSGHVSIGNPSLRPKIFL